MILTESYLILSIFALLVIGALLATILIWKLIASGGPLEIFSRRSTVEQPYKYASYECGEVPIGKTRFAFDIEYYIFPLIFIIFDVFTPFLFLWGISYNPTNMLLNAFFVGLIMFLFIGMMIAILKDGKKLTIPDYQKEDYLSLIEKASNGDEEALEEFLRIEPLTIIKKEITELETKPFKEKIKLVNPHKNENFLLAGIKAIIRKLVGWLFRWGLAKSLWIPHLGIKCCALEIPMAVGVSRFDMERFGLIPAASPRQADVMIVNGPVTYKWAARLKAIYDQMAEPKFVVALGECAIIGGPFKGSYSVVEGVNKIIPVDFYLPGCPPRPEMFLDLLITYRKRMPVEIEERRRRIIEARNEIQQMLDKILEE